MTDIKNFERNNYFYGKLMTVRDFETEQSYFIEKQRLINRLIHGAGVVCGLKVEEVEGDTTKIKIKPGVAIDCCGREIIVPEEKVVDLKDGLGETDKVYVLLKYDFCEKKSVPVNNNVSACEETCCYNRILETYKIEISEDMPGDCVPSDDGLCDAWSDTGNPEDFVDYWIKKCPKCPQEPAVLLAAITLQNSTIGEIDNAIINEEGFEKSFVFSNPRLYELIKCVEKKAGLEKDLPYIKKISWDHNKEYDFFEVAEYETFLDKLMFTITFKGSINTSTINQKTLNVTEIAYFSGNIGTYKDVEVPVKKRDLPILIECTPTEVESKVSFKFIPPEFKENLRKALAAFTAKEAVGAKLASSTYAGVARMKTFGLRLLIQLKGDFVWDDHGNPVDANHLKGELPTGNGTPGGLFESWFDLKVNSSRVDKVIKEIRINRGISGENLAENTRISEKTMELLLPALINNKVSYSKNGLFYPLPNPVRTIVVYDGEYKYLRYSAERLKVGLWENGIRVEIKSSDELTPTDKNSYEIILLRGMETTRTTKEKMSGVELKINLSVDTGDTNTVNNPYIADSNVFIVGGKNRKAVDSAVSGFLKNYTVP